MDQKAYLEQYGVELETTLKLKQYWLRNIIYIYILNQSNKGYKMSNISIIDIRDTVIDMSYMSQEEERELIMEALSLGDTYPDYQDEYIGTFDTNDMEYIQDMVE